jgi:HlyD family secretion protein
MFKLILKLFTFLDSEQRKNFFVLQILVILMGFAEVIGVASIIPFMSLVGDTSQLQQDNFISQVYQASGIATEEEFIFLLGIGVLIVLAVCAIISMITAWRLSMFANVVGSEIADKLYTYYLKQNWLFHASGSSAKLTKQIANETLRVTNNILTPLLLMNSKIGLIIIMVVAIFIYDPLVAIVGSLFFGTAYFILYGVVRARLLHNGKSISHVTEQRFSLMNEGFGGIKDILLLGRDNDFINRFQHSGQKLAYSMGNNVTLSLVPRYFMELVAFGSIIGLLLYLMNNYQSDLSKILPIVSVYALACIKLLPAFQQVYNSTANIKGNIAALESIEKDLSSAMQTKFNLNNTNHEYLIPKDEISLENITFTYPEKEKAVINSLNMLIPANNVVGIVGSSGSGKSTIIDILMGLIEPNNGNLKVDNVIINNENIRQWQNTIGFVAQSIFLSDGTIAENIAFGIPKNDINQKQVLQALKQAHLYELVQGLEYGIDTLVGERGVKLSGGQRQRIGIARALYHKAEVLVFDEATSSLDGVTEKMIMQAIQNFKGLKTIILIAHRLKTVQKCDQIFFIENGQVIDKGTFNDLLKTNSNFKRMAEHS